MQRESLNPGRDNPSVPMEVALAYIQASLRSIGDGMVACKLLLYQMHLHGVTFTDLRLRFPSAKYILIYRQTAFRQYLSNEVAHATRRWGSRGEPFDGRSD